MPKQKDLKHLVRARMEKTGESYTAARFRIISRNNYAEVAGMSEESVRKATGRTWDDWVRLLDAAGAAKKPHRDIARHVASLGTPSWWSQMVTVGYERIRGLRQRGQQRSGTYEASKSRTFNVPLKRLFGAFADDDVRRRWLDAGHVVKSSTREKRMRLAFDDGTSVQIGFFAKTESKSMVAIQHEKLRDRTTADATKKEWSERFDRLAELL